MFVRFYVVEVIRSPILPYSQDAVFCTTSFRKTTSYWKKNDETLNGFYFFTYEWSRRRLSLIKMINGVEEVLILLFTAFRYEYLF